MTATDTEAALLAAIRENPGEDAPRLVYADALADAGRELEAIMQRIIAETGRDEWRLDYAAELERTAGRVDCRVCGGKGYRFPGQVLPAGGFDASCSDCFGTGRVSDGRAELADFVRVQVELAKRNPRDCNQGTCRTGGRDRPCTACREREELQARERELWGYLPTRNGVRSYFESTLPGAAFCPESDGGKHLGSGFPIVLIQRGLPSVVRCALAEWMGEPCSQCSGRGHRTLYGDGSGPWAKCQYCVDGRTPGIGPRLAQAWPIERVEMTDKLPPEIARGVWRWGKRVSLANGPYGLDDPIYSLARGDYPTEAAARAALSDALIAWARSQPIEEGRS